MRRSKAIERTTQLRRSAAFSLTFSGTKSAVRISAMRCGIATGLVIPHRLRTTGARIGRKTATFAERPEDEVEACLSGQPH